MDIAWFKDGRDWGFQMNATYISLTVIMVISYALFARGFISLSILFENELLKWASYLLVMATVGLGILDVSTLSVEDIESIWMPYTAFAMVFGVLSILFGVSLLRLQDGMGELSRIAGILNIAIGCVLLPVVLFFIYPVIMIPATLVEILLLYRGYEYLSKSV